MSNHPDIILGQIRERAEMIVNRYGSSYRPDDLLDDMLDAKRILALIEQHQSATLTRSLEQSIEQRNCEWVGAEVPYPKASLRLVSSHVVEAGPGKEGA
jgi:hypothetical protein